MMIVFGSGADRRYGAKAAHVASIHVQCGKCYIRPGLDIAWLWLGRVGVGRPDRP